MVEQTLGWKPEEYKDYQYVLQTISGANPMKSSNLIKAKAPGGDGSFIIDPKTGKAAEWSPQEWVDYWRKIYNVDERGDAFRKSYQSNDPYERVMALILGQGSATPVYGFDAADRLGQAAAAFKNQVMKFPEGAFEAAISNSEGAKWIENDQRDFNIPKESFMKSNITDENQFSQKVQEIWGKSWEDLSDDDKAFVLILSRTSKEDADDRDLASKGRTRIEQLSGLHQNTTLRPEIQNMDSADAVARILYHSNYDDYKRVKDSYYDWQNYQEDREQDDKRLAENAFWSGNAQTLGNMGGTVARYLWEAAVIRGLTGGISAKSLANPKLVKGVNVGGIDVNSISDRIGGYWDAETKTGSGILGLLGRRGISPASVAGQNMMQFTANLIGTIPEDILQTSIDNVLTYNAEENKHLLDFDQMSENFKNNLITMALFNAGAKGVSTIKRLRMARQAAKQADLDKVLNIDGLAADIDDITRAGNTLKVENEKVSVVDGNGNEKVLENITPEAGEMIQQVRAADSSAADATYYSKTGINDQNRALSEIPSDLQHRWFENGDVNAREQIADILKNNAEIRNASINRLYEDYVYWQNAVDHKPLDFNEWLNTDMAMYRYSTPSLDGGNETLSYSIVPGGLTGFGGEGQIIIIKPKDTLGRPQLAGYPNENEVFVSRDVAENSKPKLGSYENAVLEENILRGKHDGKRAAAMRALTSREIDIWSSKELNDGDRIFTSSKEADELYGHNNVKKHRVKLDEVEWSDTGHGTYKKVKFEIPKLETSKTEVETPKAEAETPIAETAKVDYGYTPLDDALNVRIRPNQVDINNWHTRTQNRIMNDFDNNFIKKFHDKFGDVEASDFDWIWYNSNPNFKGLSPEQIVGTTDPTTGRTIQQRHIDAAKWWAEQPQVKALRQASLKSLGRGEDFNILGYLPHTDYDPRFASFEEAMAGTLWKKSTGASIMSDGDYKGYGGDFRDRYNTFVSNMLWDARAKDIATAKLLDEVRMDGQEITPELEANARKVVDGEQNITRFVNDTDSVKATAKALEDYGQSANEVDWKKINKEQQKAAEDSGIGKSYHDVYADNKLYLGSNSYAVNGQLSSASAAFNQLSDSLKKISIEKQGNLYDNGAAALINAPKDAQFIANRYDHEGVDLRDAVTEVVTNRSHRSAEATEEVVDRIMGRIGQIQGPVTKAKLIQSLNNSLKWEAMTRLKRWLALAKYDQFNAATRKVIDRVLFNHVQMESIKNNPKIHALGAKALDALTSLRYRSLFYGNIKNALLQISELNRYFSSFKWGDVASMAKEMATNPSFRARVDDMVLAVAPMTPQMRKAFSDSGVKLSNKIYRAYADLSENMDVKSDGVVFKKLKNAQEIADTVGLAPIEAAEAYKNRMMVAALVKEADNLGLTGDDALRHIRNRFERVGLAADEMGQIGMASNPLAKMMLFLQNFQIRELGMHYYNIKDATGMAKSMPGKVLAATNYLTKVFGAKLATTLILARLGYSATQTMGVDPFGLIDQYNQLDQEDMELPDYLVKYNPLFSGGVMSLLSDMYFMARKSYEESEQKTLSDEVEGQLESSWGVNPEALFSPDALWDTIFKFVPGSTFAGRIGQMNDLMDTGWAVSSTGNKMYTAPNDTLNTILGYLFGRSATQNAMQYRQTYGDNLLQTLGRFARQINPFADYNRDSFDPIDTKNYTDWFKGDANDRQQFEKGRRYFQSERDRILDEYEQAISRSYASEDEISEAQNDMNRKLEELYDKLERFVDAYERKNGTIDSAMAKQIINLLNTGRKITGTAKEREQRRLDEYNKALGRYSSLGFSPVGTYSGANMYNPTAETKYQGSPQWRAAVSGYYDRYDEAVNVLKRADDSLAPIRKELNAALSNAYNKKNYDEVERIQRSYLEKFDDVVSPIIAAYGNGIFGSTDVVNQIKDMLSTGTNSRTGNLIPSDDYRKDKYGRYRSMPFETVDVKKWAQQRFRGKLYQQPTISSQSTAQEDIDEIKRLSANGQKSRARARALVLKTRVDNQTRALSKEQYNWLNNFLEGGK